MKIKSDDEKKKRKPGNQGHEVTEKNNTICKALHSFFKGNQVKIAYHMGIDPVTLRRHYREILDGEIQEIDECVESSLFYQIMVLRNVAATIFYLKTRMPEKYGEQKQESEYNKAELLKDIKELLPR